MTSTEPTAQRAQNLLTARERIGRGLILFTAFLSVLWVLPKGDWGLLWLLFAIPAIVFVLLVRTMVGTAATNTSRAGTVIGVGALLAVLWFVGLWFTSADAGTTGLLWLPWKLLTLLWPLVMAAGVLTRFILLKLVPRAVQKDKMEQVQRAQQAAVEEARQREIAYERRMQREVNSQAEPTAPGRTTGFEPSAHAAVEVPELPFLFGAPGAGLSGSGFRADQVSKGQAGELNFARALQHSGLLDRFATFWSVHMPDEEVGASATFSSDIDCVIVTGTTIHLLDMKNYTQGDTTWTIEDGQLRLVDNPTGGYIGKARSMSRNMELALGRVRTKFRALGVGHQVSARVVFMPTDNGIGTIDPSVRWPGDIAAEPLDQTLAQLHAEPPFDPNHPDSEHIVRVFRWLVKDESGSAPRPGEAWKRAPGMRRRARAGSAPATPATAESAPTTAATEVPAAATPATPARTCPECGAAFGPEWTFCWECGRA